MRVRMRAPALCVSPLLVMLTQEIPSVVVAVRCSDHGVDVVARGGVAVGRDAALVVELDEDHRAVKAVVPADLYSSRRSIETHVGSVKPSWR